MFPVQPALLIQAPRAVAQEATNSNNTGDIHEGDGGDAAIRELGELASDPGVGLSALGGGLFLGGPVGSGGFLVAPDALGLRFRLDVLL